MMKQGYDLKKIASWNLLIRCSQLEIFGVFFANLKGIRLPAVLIHDKN